MANPHYCSTGWSFKDKLDESWDKVEKLWNTGLADSSEMFTVEEAIDELSGMWEEHLRRCAQTLSEEELMQLRTRCKFEDGDEWNYVIL